MATNLESKKYQEKKMSLLEYIEYLDRPLDGSLMVGDMLERQEAYEIDRATAASIIRQLLKDLGHDISKAA